MKIAIYGSSLLSSYWNGAATYYRGILRALAAHSHAIVFFEPDAYERQSHCDIAPPSWCRSVVYAATPSGVSDVLAQAAQFDVVIKCSGVGVFDSELMDGILRHARPDALRLFWDVDAPATLAEIAAAPHIAIRRGLPRLDAVLTYGGGEPVIAAYRDLGAALCVPLYNAVDPDTHHPVPPQAAYAADLSFLGNRLPDREARVDHFLLAPAAALPRHGFILGGAGWHDKACPPNVDKRGHVPTEAHNAFNCSARAVLNISRDSMAINGFSPATRVFEAAGAAACIITDAWDGIDRFLSPDKEILVARDGQDVTAILPSLTETAARDIGEAARRRVLADHTYDRRAADMNQLLGRLRAIANAA